MNKLDKETLYAMNMGDEISRNQGGYNTQVKVLRVPGGWIYQFSEYRGSAGALHTQFVPLPPTLPWLED